DVELCLRGRAVAYPDRTGAAIAVERNLAFGHADRAVEPIEDAQLRLGERGRIHEPPEQRSRFLVAAEREQRVDQEIRVAQPTVAVVPVAGSADLLGQRCGWRRDARAGRGENERFQDQGAADHLLAPWTIVVPGVDPALPEANGAREPGLESSPWRKNQRL